MRPPICRAHTLPLRLDHPPPPIFEPPTETDSPSDSSRGNSPASFMSLPVTDMADVDMNIDQEITIVGSVSPPSPYQSALLRPEKLNSPGLRDQFSGGRIPTPIHSNFDLAAPPPPRSRADSHITGALAIPGVARPRQRLENDYRMPSPIVEDTMETSSDLPSSQLSRLTVSQEDGMDLDTAWSQPSSDGFPWDSMPLTPSTPGRIGRARSGAFSATTAQASGRRVVFGYREECEKCRMRFPGHFTHFV